MKPAITCIHGIVGLVNCPPCNLARKRELARKDHARNPEKRRKKNREWRQRNKDNENERSARNRKANPERYKSYKGMIYPEGATDASLLEKQLGLCPICNRDIKTTFVTDHDHKTGLVRGLLCRVCNSGVGLLSDDPERVFRAFLYLKGLSGTFPAAMTSLESVLSMLSLGD